MKRTVIVAFLLAVLALVAATVISDTTSAKSVPYAGAPKVQD